MAAPFQWSLEALETLMAEDQMDQHAAVLRAFSVAELWRLRRVCRAFHRWGTAALAALPRVAALGGNGNGGPTASVEVLDLSTLRWSAGGVPALPEPRCRHTACGFADGRLVVAGGREPGRVGVGALNTALQWVPEEDAPPVQWVPGAHGWAPLPRLSQGRDNAAAVALPDGRAMVMGGGWSESTVDLEGKVLSSVEVLTADGSGWSALERMHTARDGAAAVLPCGKVVVAGGWDNVYPRVGLYNPADYSALNSAELWDPVTEEWTDLPPMAGPRYAAACCVLPSGRVAVVGGAGHGGFSRRDGEVFNGELWSALPPMAHGRSQPAAVAVAGGFVVVGGAHGPGVPNELFDEESGRWFVLPHAMAQPRASLSAVSLPASALAPPAAAARPPLGAPTEALTRAMPAAAQEQSASGRHRLSTGTADETHKRERSGDDEAAARQKLRKYEKKLRSPGAISAEKRAEYEHKIQMHRKKLAKIRREDQEEVRQKLRKYEKKLRSSGAISADKRAEYESKIQLHTERLRRREMESRMDGV
eukprot:COSAG04_NODE_25_length_37336_cov_18.966941_17_plen_534_part_00